MIKHIAFFLFLLLSGCSSIGLRNLPPELHVIGVYEGTDPSDDGRPWQSKCGELSSISCHQTMTKRKREIGGVVIVNVSITDRPIVLALSAYDKTKWIIKADKSVVIKKVILSGYHAQSIEGVSDHTSIEVYTYDSSPCSRCYQGQGYFYSYKSVPEQLEQVSGMSASTWQGKYRGLEFSIFPGMRKLGDSE